MIAEDFDALSLADAYVPELIISAPSSVSLRTLRQHSPTGDRALAEEGWLKFQAIELLVVAVETTPWLQIASLKSYADSQRLKEWETKAAAGQTFHKNLVMKHFEIRFESGSIELIAERFEYQTISVSPARIFT